MSHGAARRAVRRRVSSHSYSLTAVLPRTFQWALKAQARDYVVLKLFPNEWRFTIRPLVDAASSLAVEPGGDPTCIAVRKLVKRGNSVMVAIPRRFLHELRLLERDAILLRLADDNSEIIVQPVTRRSFGPEAPRTVLGTAEIRS